MTQRSHLLPPGSAEPPANPNADARVERYHLSCNCSKAAVDRRWCEICRKWLRFRVAAFRVPIGMRQVVIVHAHVRLSLCPPASRCFASTHAAISAVEFPDLPGCMTAGKTWMRRACSRAALALHLMGLGRGRRCGSGAGARPPSRRVAGFLPRSSDRHSEWHGVRPAAPFGRRSRLRRWRRRTARNR